MISHGWRRTCSASYSAIVSQVASSLARRRRLALLGAVLLVAAGCAAPRPVATRPDPGPSASGPVSAPRDSACATCHSPAVGTELARAIERRLVELRERGGACARYAAVLEASYRTGRITLRPYMWRVGAHLASGEARPDGRMVLAREIDSLNVGVRTIEDVLWTLEHEAAHIAFNISNGTDARTDGANTHVRDCRG